MGLLCTGIQDIDILSAPIIFQSSQNFVELTDSNIIINFPENNVVYTTLENQPSLVVKKANEFSDSDKSEKASDTEDSYRPSSEGKTSSNEDDDPQAFVSIGSLVTETLPSISPGDVNSALPSKVKKTRKRKAGPYKWKKNVRKIKRISGKSYETRKGIVVPDKTARYVDCSQCRFKCSQNISLERQKVLCQEYWALSDSDRQKAHLCSLITKTSVQRHRKRNAESNITKCKSRFYSSHNEDNEKVRVCLKFFCATFSISFQVVDLALKNVVLVEFTQVLMNEKADQLLMPLQRLQGIMLKST